MKKLLLGLLILLCGGLHSAYAAFPAGSQLFANGGLAQGATPYNSSFGLSLSAINTVGLTMICAGASATSGDFYGFYSLTGPTTQGQYSVTANTFYVLAASIIGAGSGDGGQIGYGTVALASEGTASAPAGAIYYGSSGSAFSSPFTAVGANTWTTLNVLGMKFPAGAYPFLKASGSNISEICLQGIVE